jgi:hypothetical protein
MSASPTLVTPVIGAATGTSLNVSGGLTSATLNVSGAVTFTTVPTPANGGTGQSTYTDGQLLIGNTTGNTLTKATLTAGSGITITNGHGTITIAAGASGVFGLTAQTASASVTVVAGNLYPLDCTSGAGAVTFPASASVNDVFGLAIFGRNGWSVNTNGLNYYGTAYSALTGGDEGLTLFIYTGATRGWIDL